MDTKIKWWKNALIYQIYPLSFNDSNDDGIGDIKGIIEKLDYLKNYGVDVIWLSPVYESPMDDNGYDISNYYKINPIFGTLDDMKQLINKSHELNIKIIMDLVVNHTSDEHIWFKEARKSKENKYRDYYIWRKKPNDITSVFSGSAWEYDNLTNEYYFHLFSKKQPDLNWDNPNLRNEIYQMVNYWLDLGIDGFRLDVIDLIGKSIDNKKLADGPYLEERLKELYNNCFKGRDIMTVGETPGISIERAKEISEKKYLDMVFQFTHIALDEIEGKSKWALKKLDFVELKNVFEKTQNIFKDGGWNSLFWSNHDQPRAVTRYGNDSRKYRIRSAKMLFTTLYSMKGTPFVYQGEEIGMTGIKWKNINKYKDIETINMYKEYLDKGFKSRDIIKSIHAKGRDNSRTPFQWNNNKHAGFSNNEPWLSVNKNFKNINAKKDLDNKKGIYNYTKQLFKIRKENDIFTLGSFELLYQEHPKLIIYLRKYQNKQLLVISNMTKEKVKINLEKYQDHTMLLSNMKEIKLTNNTKIKPYYSAIYQRSL